MCYHVSQEKSVEQIRLEFNKPVNNRELFRQAFHLSGFDDPFVPAIACKNSGVIDMFKWRLIPTGKKDVKKFAANTRNARSETIFDLNSYGEFVDNRCLIICTGFFEPHFVTQDKPTQSYYIKPKEREFFTLGGIYSPWKGTNTFAIITVPASPLMSEVHNEGKRMPLILEGEQADRWLSPKLSEEEMRSLMVTYPHDEKLVTYRTINGVTSSRVNTNVPEVIKPIEIPTTYTDLPLFSQH
jgi:putative SOS response-associated peptidase YedK